MVERCLGVGEGSVEIRLIEIDPRKVELIPPSSSGSPAASGVPLEGSRMPRSRFIQPIDDSR
jgi:hypothetical protein